jgi:hypothetical protein
MHRYLNSPLCDESERKEIARAAVAIARRAERNVTEENGYDMLTEDSAEVNNYGANPGAAPLEPPATEEPVQFVPPDHATIAAGLKLAVRELVKEYGRNQPLETDYYYCVLERTGNEQTGAVSELKLEYVGLSENGKYLTYALCQYTEDTEVASKAILNNFAVSVELDEVLREYDENRTTEHVREYRAALSN